MALCAYVSRRVMVGGEVRPAAVIVEDGSGKIVRVAEADAPGPVSSTWDFGEAALLPGLMDVHVHVNEPGRTEWEGYEMATRAAAAGGVTTVIDMPLNCLPETTTVEALEVKRSAAAGQCAVDWRAWGGAVGEGLSGNEAHLIPLAQAGVAGFKCFLIYPGCEGLGAIDEQALRRAMPRLAETGLPLLVHAELAGPIAAATETLAGADWRRYATYLASRPDEAELAAIRLMLALCREFGCRVHVVHLSRGLAWPMLRGARAEGLPLTVETWPHYLHFAAEEIADGATLLKCAPPIRGAANREGLWRGLMEGTIDLVASDHSPCPPEMRGLVAGDFRTAWGGIASLSLSASVLWTGMSARGLGLPDLVRWLSDAPARLAGLEGVKGGIAEGADADLVVFAPEEEWLGTAEDLLFRHAVSPYVGERLRGRVKQTVVRGRTVFERGTFPGAPAGREVRG